MRGFPVLLALSTLLGACAASNSAPTDAVRIAVAPLTLPGVGRVCYDVAVTNAVDRGGATVWAAGTPGLNGGTPDGDALCSDRYGNGAGGDLGYVAPCDADGQLDADAAGERMNSVTVWFDGIYDSDGDYLDPTGPNGWRNPCVDAAGNEVGCTLNVLCEENADAPVTFSFTVMREANQGFFDIAVEFQDVFCSAKVDCKDALLHNGDERDATVVIGFACTSGANEKTVLQASDLVLTCDGMAPIVLPASAAPGQQAGPSGVFAWAVYQGDEDLTSNGEALAKCFWNRAIGLDKAALQGRTCRLSGVASASNDGVVPPVGSSAYPIVRFDVEVLSASGELCAANPLNGDVSGVTTDYLLPGDALAAPEALSASFTCRACSATDDVTCDGVDDDCDGAIDEDYVATVTQCGLGVCANSGLLVCRDGVPVDTCSAGEPEVYVNTFDDFDDDASDVYAAVFRGTLHCDALLALTPQGLACAPDVGWSEAGGYDDGGYVYGVGKDVNERHYALTASTVPRPNLLGGRIEGYFRTRNVDGSGAAIVRAQEGSGDLTTNATPGTARARYVISSRTPQGVVWSWVSKDTFAWNPNDDTDWTLHGIDLVFENFAQWEPFRFRGYSGATAADFANSVSNVTRIGVQMADASIIYANHLDASWYRNLRYALQPATEPMDIELGWDHLSLTATGYDCNNNGLDDDCDGIVDNGCPPQE